MAEQAVDAGFIARYERLKTALTGVELDRQEDAAVQRVARAGRTIVGTEDVYTLAELIERARCAGPGGAGRTATVYPLPVVPGGEYEPKHKRGRL